MKKRMLIVIAGLVVLIAGLGFFKYRQIQAAIKGGAWTPPPEAVTTTVATEAQWEGTLQMQPIEQPTQTASAGWLPTLPSSK